MRKIGLVCVVLAMGCGGGSGVPIDQFGQSYANAICAQNFKCCSSADLMGKTMSDCVNTNGLVFGAAVSTLQTAQSQGRVTYDAAKAGTCISGIRAMSCADWQKGLTEANSPPSCSAVFVAKVAASGMCTSDQECTSGQYCAGLDASKDPPTPGTCAATVAMGGSCANGETCATDLYCGSTTQTCQPKKAAGTACSTDNECVNSCNIDTQQCSCYSGCAVGGRVSTRSALLSLLLAAAAIAAARLGRRRGPGPARIRR